MTTLSTQRSLRGLAISRIGNPIETTQQLGGGGTVFNQALLIPSHLGWPWNSLEYVTVAARKDGIASSVGEHMQETDEIYFVTEGTGILTTNGVPQQVGSGFLAIAPKGTRHTITNMSASGPLSFLVLELQTPPGAADHEPDHVENLFALLEAAPLFHPALLGQHRVPLEVASVPLMDFFSAPWGMLRLVRLPAGARVEAYREDEHDEILLTVSGGATICLPDGQGHGSERRIPGEGQRLNVVVPAGVVRRIINDSSRDPLTLLSILVRRR